MPLTRFLHIQQKHQRDSIHWTSEDYGEEEEVEEKAENKEEENCIRVVQESPSQLEMAEWLVTLGNFELEKFAHVKQQMRRDNSFELAD